MNTGYKEPNVHVITRIVIIGAVGIIALAFGWLALKQNTERRSKAALTEKIYKSWEFKGTAEGWVGESGTTLKPSAEALIASFSGTTSASIRQDLVNTALPYGNKYAKIALSLIPGVARVLGTHDEAGVGDWSDSSSQEGAIVDDLGDEIITPETGPLPTHAPVPPGCQPMPPCVKDGTCQLPPPEEGWCPTPTCTPPPPPCTSGPCPLYEPPPPPGGWCPEPSPKTTIIATPTRTLTPVPGGTSFTLTMYYQLKGKTTWEKPVVKAGLSSKGSFAEYPMLLPGIAPLTVARLKLQVSNVKTLGTAIAMQDYTMRIDRVTLTGPVPKPTPKPTCTPEPPCVIKNECQIPAPEGGWCPRVTPTRRPVTPTPTRRPTPKPTCTPEPPCVIKNECQIPAPEGGWCPRVTPTRRPVTPTPTRRPTPTPEQEASALNEDSSKHWTCLQFPDASWCQ